MRNSIAITLLFIATGMQALFFIYPNALFLAFYPRTWLSYYYIGIAAVELLFAFLLAPILNRPRNIAPAIFLIVLAVITFGFFWILPYKFYYLPLIFTLFLDILSLTIALASSSAVLNSFTLLEYKRISSTVSAASSLGIIVTSVAAAALLRYAPIQSLAYPIVIGTVLTAAGVLLLPPLPMMRRTVEKSEPFGYPLFRYVFLFSFITVIAYILIEYSLKFKLMDQSADAIGRFMADFNLICGIVSLGVGYIASKYIIKHFNVTALFIVLPIFWIITGLFVAFLPTFYLVALFASGKLIIYYTLTYSARDLTLNVLPVPVKISGQIYLKSLASPVAGLLTGIFLFFLEKSLTISIIAVIAMLLSIGLIYLVRGIHKRYIDTLRDSIYLNRFDTTNIKGRELSELKKQRFKHTK